MLITVPRPDPRPLGWSVGLESFGIPYRWVCIEAPVQLGKSKAVEKIREALFEYLSQAGDLLAVWGAGAEVAEEIVRGVEHIRQPDATVAVPGGSLVNLRDLAGAEIPHAARFGLYLADRVIQNRNAEDLLKSCSLVVQERGAFSTYVYQCVLGGISPSLFESVTTALTPQRPDLLILLSPSRDGGRDAAAYANPPLHILRHCAKNFALVSTEGLTPKGIAAAVVEAMTRQRLVLPLDR